MELELDWIRSLAEIVSSHGLTELQLKDGEREITLSREGPRIVAATAVPEAAALLAPAGLTPAAVSAEPDDLHVEIKSPMVGTFYRSPSPEAGPFVDPGDEIGDETVLCIIEAMKVMNEIKAEMQGIVADVLVENGEAVEYGQPLFLVRRKI